MFVCMCVCVYVYGKIFGLILIYSSIAKHFYVCGVLVCFFLYEKRTTTTKRNIKIERFDLKQEETNKTKTTISIYIYVQW